MSFPYESEEGSKVGYDCGFTFLVGGRPELTSEQQAQLASCLAEECCASLVAQRAFVASFQRGYSERLAKR